MVGDWVEKRGLFIRVKDWCKVKEEVWLEIGCPTIWVALSHFHGLGIQSH